jgi:hypothetical protein
MSAITTTPNVRGEATYKGRKYAVIVAPRQTNFGYRAKLAFTNLEKKFWVDGHALSDVELFPQSVPGDEYRPAPTRKHIPDHERIADSACDELNDPKYPETPSYCAHCGQVIR